MTEVWIPFAMARPVVNHGGAISTPVLGLIDHTQEGNGSCFGIFNTPSFAASSTLWIAKSGAVEQYVALDMRAWAQAAGNARYWSVEREGFVGDALTEEQLAAEARVYAYLQSHPLAAFGFALAEAPGQPGLGWHGMGGADWGGHTGCPGDIRKAQRPQIIARAQIIAGAGGTTTSATEDDSWVCF